MDKHVDFDDLLRWREEVSQQVAEHQEIVATAQKKLREYTEKLELIDQLLELEKAGSARVSKENSASKLTVVDACVEILLEEGKPMHINDIHSRLLNRGVALPGKGNEANVIARIQRSEGRIVRTGRGTYGLPELGAEEVKPTKKKMRAAKK